MGQWWRVRGEFVQLLCGDVLVRTRNRVYVLRVDWTIGSWLGEDCIRRGQYHTFVSSAARAGMLRFMVDAPSVVEMTWVLPEEWVSVSRAPILFKVEGRA